MIQSVSICRLFISVSKLVHQINLNHTIALGSAIFGTVTLVLLRKKGSNHLSAAVITLDGSM